MGIFSGFALDKLPAIHLPWKNTTDGMIRVHKSIQYENQLHELKKAHIQKNKTNQKRPIKPTCQALHVIC